MLSTPERPTHGSCHEPWALRLVHVATAGVVLATLSASGCCSDEAAGRRNFTWPRRGAHLLVDTEGLVKHSGLSLVQHAPLKSSLGGLLVSPEYAWEPYIYAYHSLVQVSAEQLRIYYDAIGPDGRFLCVAVSTNAGTTFTKPMLGLVSYRGSKDNNIVLQGSPGNVFLDKNPHCAPSAVFKAVMNVGGDVQIFGSEDGFNFSSIASKCLSGSDTQNIVFYDAVKQDYVFYGRTHLPAGLGGLPGGETARNVTPCYGAEQPGRSVGSFYIGQNLTAPWPVTSANSAPTILNTDSQDPPCMDTYTSAATPLHDAIFMFPQVYHHYPTTFIKQSYNPTYDDGLLEARLAVSRSGGNVSYISRRAWLPRGVGQARPHQTCFFDGEFDAASTAVAQGLWQVGDETWLVGWGAQYTHAGLDNWTMAASAKVKSGLQLLRIRRNRFVSLSTSSQEIATAGLLQTASLSRPTHCSVSAGFRLELNIIVEAGRGATIRLLDGDGKLVAVSNPLAGIDDVALRVAWNVIGSSSRRIYAVDGCAYTSAEYPDGRPCPRPGRPGNSRPIPCESDSDCVLNVPFEPGTCNSAPVSCLNATPRTLPGKVCRSPVPGGDVCGTWVDEPVLEPKGDDLSQFWPVGAKRSLHMDLFSTDLFSIELTCREDH